MNATAPTAPTEAQKAAAIAKAVVAKFSADRGNILGPYLLGYAVNMILFGVMLVQVVHWFNYAREDKKFVKTIVIGSCLAATGSFSFLTAYIWRVFVWHFGDWLVLLEFDWIVNYIVYSVIGTVFVQVFYADRAYRLNKTIAIPLLVAAGVLSVVIVTIWSRIKAVKYPSLLQADHFVTEFYFWLGGTLAVDLLLTSSIAWGLWRQRTGWSSTNRLVIKLIRITFEAQVPPTILGLTMMIIYGSNPTSAWIHSVGSFQLQVYVNGMLAVLNSRTALRQGSRSQATGEKENTFAISGSGSRHQQATVVINTETHTESFKLDPLYTPTCSLNRSPFINDIPPVPTKEEEEAQSQVVLTYAQSNESRVALRTVDSRSMV